ncbi:cell surface protein [Sulfitobacter donghicola]|nr:cell surface protein [Sulfitobacter donghicola]
MKKMTMLAGSVLAGTLAVAGVSGVADASSVYKTAKHQTTQGDRPYGGIAPKGMSEKQYAELEKRLPKASEVSTKEYNQLLDKETQRIADKYDVTIHAPQKTFHPHQ